MRAARRSPAFATAAAALWLGCSEVEDPALQPVTDPRFDAPAPTLPMRAPDADRTVFWGDLHIHTSYSYDAYTMGVRAMPDDAYAYAKGATIEHGIGYPIRASRPLDFAAVTDHAEYLGVARSLGEAESEAMDAMSLREVLETRSPLRITWNFINQTLFKIASSETRDKTFAGDHTEASSAAWQDILAAAARHDDPGRFTTFVGYEWTSMPAAQNLHRNVIYRNERAPETPFSSLDSADPEDLWRALDVQRQRGLEMISIPHNGNISNGLMYDRVALDGSALDADYAKTRMKNEPISEILQVKGQSEAHPSLSGQDEFADFELFEQLLSARADTSEPRGSYARTALRTGLEMSARDGFNPYRFGVIGSSDSHNASSSVEEDNYHGKLPLLDGTPAIRLGVSLLLPSYQNRGLQWSAAGLAAVWAEENTRGSLFDAMRRKETYATSGPRITLRFFGGWNFPESLVREAEFVETGYRDGAPMGGTLPPRGAAEAPRFAVVAMKDPLGANLDRIQIVKGWLDAEGASHERIFDVVASDGRVADPSSHRVRAVGNTVDVANAAYQNSIGAAQLAIVWSDPDFEPRHEAFYYARVLEIPTPRWSTFDAAAMGRTPPEPTSLQERAITSAIWYEPTVTGGAGLR